MMMVVPLESELVSFILDIKSYSLHFVSRYSVNLWYGGTYVVEQFAKLKGKGRWKDNSLKSQCK